MDERYRAWEREQRVNGYAGLSVEERIRKGLQHGIKLEKLCNDIVRGLSTEQLQGVIPEIINFIHDRRESNSMTFILNQIYPIKTPEFQVEAYGFVHFANALGHIVYYEMTAKEDQTPSYRRHQVFFSYDPLRVLRYFPLKDKLVLTSTERKFLSTTLRKIQNLIPHETTTQLGRHIESVTLEDLYSVI